MSIPVICDRCRQTGFSGDGDFSHLGDLLDFEPVPRKTRRVDGWTAERQRAFIAAVSATGSKRQAALAIGMSPFGVDRLLESDGNAGFKAAFDRAMLIASANGSMKIAAGVADAAARNAQLTPPSRLRGLDPSPPLDGDGQGWGEDSEADQDQKWELLERIGVKFMRKVAAEREARLSGQIVAADFYLRQITMMEVMLDLMSARLGFDAPDVLRQLRRGEHGLIHIASTALSDGLDQARRRWWAEEGDPDRPPYPDARYIRRLRHRDGDYAIGVDDSSTGPASTPARGYAAEEWAAMSGDAQRAARAAQFAQDADEQREWESRAIAEHKAQSRSDT